MRAGLAIRAGRTIAWRVAGRIEHEEGIEPLEATRATRS